MNDDIYVNLIKRMNQNSSKHRVNQARVNYLKELYTEDQAALIANYPLGAYTAKALSEKLNRNEGELKKMLQQMVEEDLIFRAKNDDGEWEYSVFSWEPGFTEIQHWRRLQEKDEEKLKKLNGLIDKMNEADRVSLDEFFNSPERMQTAKDRPTPLVSRLVPIEEHVEQDKELASWERISAIIENETIYAVAECGCKEIAKEKGEPCQSGAPSKCCIWFGKVAEYMIDKGYGERYTKEDVYKLIKECQDAGLVQFTANRSVSENIVVCNCCKCCCAFVKLNKRTTGIAGFPVIQNTNFVSRVDEDICTGCGECVDQCQLEAIEMNDDIADINEEYCLGCGACVSICPTGSLRLERISNYKPPEPEIEIVGSGV